MFTGMIETVGRSVSLKREGSACRLTLDSGAAFDAVSLGESIAVNGVCLTVVQVDGGVLAFDLSPETADRTALAALSAGDPVNLERALRVGDRLGGHFVSGHVDGVGRLKSVKRTGESRLMAFSVPSELAAMMIPKGSIAVDGISLAVAELAGDSFSVAVIPHTCDATNLGRRKPGDAVNIETDMLAKMVFKAVGRLPGQGISEAFLREHGF